MPDVHDVREIIRVRVDPLVPAPASASRPRSAEAGPVIDHGTGSLHDPLRFSTILGAIPQYRIATHHSTELMLFDGIRWLSMALRCSRWGESSRAQEVPKASRSCLRLPGTALQACESPSLRTPTDSHPLAPVRGSQGPQVGVACPGVATVFASNLGDSERSGLRSCQRRTAPSPTCGLRTSRSSSTSPRARCPGGARRGRGLTSTAREEPFSTAAMTWIPGHAQSADAVAPGICRCGGTPMPGRTAAPMKKRRGSEASTRALHTAHSLLREVSVSPTLARRSLRRDTIPHPTAGTSHPISSGSVTR